MDGIRVAENDEDVATKLAMVDDDNWSTRSSRTESIKRWCLQKVFEARQRPDLRNNLVALRQTFPMLHHETTELALLLAVFQFVFIILLHTRRDSHRQGFEFLIDRGEFLCQV